MRKLYNNRYFLGKVTIIEILISLENISLVDALSNCGVRWCGVGGFLWRGSQSRDTRTSSITTP